MLPEQSQWCRLPTRAAAGNTGPAESACWPITWARNVTRFQGMMPSYHNRYTLYLGTRSQTDKVAACYLPVVSPRGGHGRGVRRGVPTNGPIWLYIQPYMALYSPIWLHLRLI